MSDAERPGRTRERLEWGDAAATDGAEPVDDADTTADPDESADADANADADEGELCVIEDPTCEACQ